jgi:hypothetical protein
MGQRREKLSDNREKVTGEKFFWTGVAKKSQSG